MSLFDLIQTATIWSSELENIKELSKKLTESEKYTKISEQPP